MYEGHDHRRTVLCFGKALMGSSFSSVTGRQSAGSRIWEGGRERGGGEAQHDKRSSRPTSGGTHHPHKKAKPTHPCSSFQKPIDFGER